MGALVNRYAYHPRKSNVMKEDENTMIPFNALGDRVYYQTIGNVKKCDVCILYSYGNGMTVEKTLYQMTKVQDSLMRHWGGKVNFVIYCYDIAGYGKTEGVVGEEHTNDAALTVYRHICRQHKDQPLFLWGFSLGSVPTCYVANYCYTNPDDEATVRPPTGIILAAPMSELVHFRTNVYVFDILPDMIRIRRGKRRPIPRRGPGTSGCP